MLSHYHREFLRLLAERGVKFIVIGGQARLMYYGTPTKDLDLWAEDGAELQDALTVWMKRYSAGLDDGSRLPHPELRFWYPDDFRFRMHGTDRDAGGIDILTTMEDRRLQLDEFYERATVLEVDGCTIRFLSSDDVEAVSPPRELAIPS